MLVLLLVLVLGNRSRSVLGGLFAGENQNEHELDIGREKELEHELDIEHEDENENQNGIYSGVASLRGS